jgi:cell division protease FtsH
MSEALGSVAYDRDRSPFLQPNLPIPQERNYSEETAHAVDAAVRILVDDALEHAAAILQRNRALLDRTAAALLETETLNEPDIEKLKQTIVRDGPGPAMLPSTEDGAQRHDGHRVLSGGRSTR